MLSFGSVGMKNMMYISLQSYVAIGTRGDIDTDIDIGAFSRYDEYEDDNGTHILTIEKRVHTTEYSKGVYVDKKYVLLESNAEITKPILDKMDTVKKVRFIGPIIWFMANLLKNK